MVPTGDPWQLIPLPAPVQVPVLVPVPATVPELQFLPSEGLSQTIQEANISKFQGSNLRMNLFQLEHKQPFDLRHLKLKFLFTQQSSDQLTQ